LEQLPKVLIFGGTGDGLKLAAVVAQMPDRSAIYSLAGRTHAPTLPNGIVRVGGFGGVAGLVAYLRREQIDRSIDITHPFARQMSWNAAMAAAECHIPHLIFERPEWERQPEDDWIEVNSIQAAADILTKRFNRIFLTIGRQEIAPFTTFKDRWFLTRSIDPPTIDLPPGELLLARGPFTVASEIKLLKDYRIEAIVTKNSGGDATFAKIIAARTLNLPVIIVQRPLLPQGDRVSTIKDAIAWLKCD
jgi:precorrin-6A/cobalt-precorrin-6A reductase